MDTFKLEPDEHFPVREDLLGALERYLNCGYLPGGFMTAVLQNNLKEACGRGDADNSKNLFNIVGYIYNNIPSSAWGSPEAVNKWMEQFAKESEAV